jgi:plastocyanin
VGRRLGTAAASLLFALALVGCAGDEDDGGLPSVGPDCADRTAADAFSVELIDYAFDPGCLIVAADEPFDLSNTGEAVHTFTIDGTGVDIQLGPGDTDTSSEGLGIAPGVYLLRCTLHAQMLGTIEVR